MYTDLLPGNEAERLEALRRLELIGTAPEPSYDRLVRLATTLLDVPIALISLLDSDRSWFKARVGLDLAETSREASFCAHTILQDDGEAFVVDDTWMDDRFENNPLVIGSPRVRFYAGHPLRAPSGEAVGTLSVIDRQPRSLTSRERLALADLAALVEELMALRLSQIETHTAEESSAEPASAEPSSGQAWTEESWSDESDVATVTFAGAATPDQLARLDHLDEVENALEAHRLMLESTTDIVVVLDAEAQIRFATPSLERVLGHTGDFRHPDGALALVHPDDRALARAELTSVLAGVVGTEPFNMRVLTATGSIRNMECTAENRFANRNVGGVILTLRDVSERHLLSQMLAFQSTHDRLTELPNRMLFQEHLSPALSRARRERRLVAVCYLDLDGFQELNDQLGHAAGDELLVDVAKRIRSSIRSGDSAARVGGDEFAVLLDPVANPDEAVLVAQRIVAAISGPHSLQAGVSSCGASAGVALASDDDDATALIARAARALSGAKRDGVGRVLLAPGGQHAEGLV